MWYVKKEKNEFDKSWIWTRVDRTRKLGAL